MNAWHAVLGRIQLLHSRFNYDEFADWLSLGATQLCYGLDDSQVSRLLALLAAAGFKRGFDATHLQQSLVQGMRIIAIALNLHWIDWRWGLRFPIMCCFKVR